ncbi:MAG TPA: ATP-binding protein, partial [Spirochaetota bacterium]|nr:ATP-binding protein [Spirochaetota bacterium]
LSSIPEKSEIINKPESFWKVHRTAVIIAAIILFVLSYSVIVLLIHKKRLTVKVHERTAELNDREQKLNMALDNSGQIAWDYDLTTDTITVSRGWDEKTSTGTSEKTIRFSDFVKTFHPDDINMTYKLIDDHKTGKTPGFEEMHRIILPDGTVKWMLARGKIVQKDSDGYPLQMSGVSIDITYIKQIEEELSRSRLMMRLVLDTIPIGVFWKDADHVYKGCNNFFAHEMGFNSPEEIAGRTDKDLVFRENYRDFILSDSEVIETGKPKINYEETITLSSGKKYIFRKSKIPLTDENEKITGLLGTVEDITEQRQLQDEIHMMQRLESVGILAAGIAHDFNNILMGITGAISVLKFLNPSDQKSMEWIEKAESLCITASELTSRLITFSKGGTPVLTEVSLTNLINEVSDFIPDNSGIEIEINTGKSPDVIFLDERQIRQVIRNIILNSIESMPDGGVININSTIEVLEPYNNLNLNRGSYVKISFSDSGKGIKPEDTERIFDPYYTTKEMGTVKGRGLGLPICHSIIKNHKGTITVESLPGKGTKINIYLPEGLEKSGFPS